MSKSQKIKLKLKTNNSNRVISPEKLTKDNWSFADDLLITRTILQNNLPVTGSKFDRVNIIRSKLFGLDPLTDYKPIFKKPYKLLIYKNMLNWYLAKLGNTDKCTVCINSDDFDTTKPLVQIGSALLFCLKDRDNWYGFDIRSLYTLQSMSDNFINPFTNNKINDSELERFNKKLAVVKQLGFITSTDRKANLTSEDRFNLLVVDLFHKLHELDFTVDSNVLTTMSFIQLKELYCIINDIWSYRLQHVLTIHQKKAIVRNGIVFAEAGPVNKMVENPINKRLLLRKVIRNIERLITEGTTHDDRKLGATYFMIGLAQVSHRVAIDFPWLFEIANGE